MSLAIKKYRVEMTFDTVLLGTKPCDPEVHKRWVASKNPKGAQKDEGQPNPLSPDDKGVTVFQRTDEGILAVNDYQLKGFFKAAADAIRAGELDTEPGTAKKHQKKWGAGRGKVDKYLHITPRTVLLFSETGKPITVPAGRRQRPLRAETPTGQRVMLASSEFVDEGTKAVFTVETLGKLVTLEMLQTMLDFGRFNGMGQWRNAGYGQFTYTIEEE